MNIDWKSVRKQFEVDIDVQLGYSIAVLLFILHNDLFGGSLFSEAVSWYSLIVILLMRRPKKDDNGTGFSGYASA